MSDLIKEIEIFLENGGEPIYNPISDKARAMTYRQFIDDIEAKMKGEDRQRLAHWMDLFGSIDESWDK